MYFELDRWFKVISSVEILFKAVPGQAVIKLTTSLTHFIFVVFLTAAHDVLRETSTPHPSPKENATDFCTVY